ncbi:MAG: hypothetical protein B6244_00910 [Candidatus Cloacimonetes bacterium 4572_55]|nr:MAG: hypothetical protein B6244_00910 [Candidatus Cloacimonetes bacterium 4572_55]
MKIDYSNIMANQIGSKHGLVDQDFQLSGSHRDIMGERERGEIGFYRLPYDTETVKSIQEFANSVKGKYSDVVVLGIGGSALGAISLQTALAHPHTRQLPGFPRLHILDNIDPDFITSLIDAIDLDRTLFIVITKSGGTAETMSQFIYFRKILLDRFGEGWKQRMVAITDKEKGYLRKIVDQEGLTSFEVPSDVGGRFSVLTTVGLLPAALAGFDIVELMRGAADMDQSCQQESILKNPAYLFATAQYQLNRLKNKSISVMMPYSNRLRDVADWYRQLWAESLGKKEGLGGQTVYVGQTPIKALGTTDQHSQVQLYAEGPNDKVIVFLRVEEFRTQGKLPESYPDIDSVNYLAGHSLAELINTEQAATAMALAQEARPNMTISIPKVNAYWMGQLFFMLEAATAYSGCLYGINPYDQPGVEQGKKMTYALMGRPDHAEYLQKLKENMGSKTPKILTISA